VSLFASSPVRFLAASLIFFMIKKLWTSLLGYSIQVRVIMQ